MVNRGLRAPPPSARVTAAIIQTIPNASPLAQRKSFPLCRERRGDKSQENRHQCGTRDGSTIRRLTRGRATLAEAVATGGLIFVILRAPVGKASAMVACYIGAAYWFTASTSFANPAAVLGRMLSESFAGIAPGSAAAFVLAQCVGGVTGILAANFLTRPAANGE